MTEVPARTAPVRPRELTAEELHGLDGLRVALAQVVDRTQPRAISWLWDRMRAEHDGGPAPAGFVESVAAAVGDLLAVHLPDVHWAVWPGPQGPTLGVASGARPLAPVLPFLDAQDHWRSGDRDWLHDYLARAAAHLVAAPAPQAPVPRQHFSPEDDEPATWPAPAAQHAAAPPPPAAPTPEPDPEPARSEPLEHFARDTLDHAMALLRDTGPFDGEVLAVLAGYGGRRTDLCSGEPGEALRRARALVRDSGTGRAAVVWVERNPAGLPGPPQRFPAVVVDAWDGDAGSLRLAHRFVDDVLGTDPIGEVLTVGAAYPLR